MPERIEKFDLLTTLLSNGLWLLMVFVIIYFFKSLMNVIVTLDSNIQLLGIIIVCFSVIKLFGWIGQPIIIFKTKQGRLSYK